MRESATARSKRRDLIELAVAYGLILLVIWTPRPAQRWLWWVAVGAVAFITSISFDGLDAMGLRRKNFLRSLWIVAVALALAVAAVLVAFRLHTLRLLGGPAWLIENYWAYAIWAAVQQFLLQCFFLSRLRRLVPGPHLAVFLAALIFACAHIPSPILAPLTLVWGFAACLLFLRYRNLYSLAIAHAILGIAVAITIPGPVDHNMRVGLGYLTYNPHGHYRHTHYIDRSPKP
ncbi:MAG: lysostaphin resistance A-like protein [Terracidiphilus sp.]